MKRIIFGLLVLCAIPDASALATTWIAPQRALTPDEWLEYDVSGSDAVGIGQVFAVRDTIVDVAPDGSGIPTRSISVHVARWLKGNPGVTDLSAGVSFLDTQPLHGEDLLDVVGIGREFVVMLRRMPDGWVVCDGPDPAGSGMRALQPQSSTSFEQKLRTLIARQSVDSLLSRSDLVVVGQFLEVAPCPTASELSCSRVAVERTVAGSAAAETLSVFAPLLGDIPRERALFLLRRSRPGEYETVGFQSGSQRLSAERPVRWGLSLDEIHARYVRVVGASKVTPPIRH